ncbi:Kinesin-like protein [Aphelenchoides bicaudatus]|nr:Kinesin-like protein [Aphelenchoides bicaudatus]
MTAHEALSTSMNASTISAANGEAIRVVVRCRPMSEKEVAQGFSNAVNVDQTRGTIEVQNPNERDQPPKVFTFDAVYGRDSKQMDLYYETFRDLVDSVLNGFNGTIFAYGQTGTGKTFTMEGLADQPEMRGVIPNAIDHIFQHIQASQNQQYLVRASYLEIYQDEIRDLLNKDSKKRLELKERPDTGVYVKDLTSFVTKSVQEIKHVMKVGNENRSVGQTNMNEYSSRSHALFIITIESSELGLDGEQHIRVGRLNLIDLAGSERQSKTGAQGDRFRESTKINLSLSALGNVISALVDGKGVSHVPYRDSKLTRLLQDSLGGNSKTVMIANIGPASYNVDETLSTLRYANRAKNIKNKPRINEDPKDALLREFQAMISELKQKLEKRMTSSRKRRRRPQTAQMLQGEEVVDQDDPEMYIREQQKKLDQEREDLLRNNGIIEEEKQRMLETLEKRAFQLAQEREAKSLIEAKLEAMQSKLLTGGGNLIDQTRQQQELLQQRNIELAEQKKREREILQQLELQDENTTEIQETYNNLQQEVEIKTRKLKKFVLKLQQLRSEMQENLEMNSKERQQLESSISNMNKELKLKWLIVENFVPSDVFDALRERCQYDPDEDSWTIEKPSSTQSIEDPNKPMLDSGLASASDVSSTGGDSSSGTSNKALFVKRPLAHPQNRRLTTDHELQILRHLHQKYQKSAPTLKSTTPTHHLNEVFRRPLDVEVSAEVLRFGTENLLTFKNLLICPMPVRHDYSEACKKEGLKNPMLRSESTNLVIDASKIPLPKSRDGSRPQSRRSISSSSSSKNLRARSALTKVTVDSIQQADGLTRNPHNGIDAAPLSAIKPPQPPHRTKSSALIFPKARDVESPLNRLLYGESTFDFLSQFNSTPSFSNFQQSLSSFSPISTKHTTQLSPNNNTVFVKSPSEPKDAMNQKVFDEKWPMSSIRPQMFLNYDELKKSQKSVRMRNNSNQVSRQSSFCSTGSSAYQTIPSSSLTSSTVSFNNRSPSSGIYTDSENNIVFNESARRALYANEQDPKSLWNGLPPTYPGHRARSATSRLSVMSSPTSPQRSSLSPSIDLLRPFRPTRIPKLMTKSASVERRPHMYSSRMSSSMYTSGSLTLSVSRMECLEGSMERLAEVDDDRFGTPQPMMSNSSTIRHVIHLQFPRTASERAIISPLCTVRMSSSMSVSQSMSSSLCSFKSSKSMLKVLPFNCYPPLEPTESERAIIEERMALREADRYFNSFGGRIKCTERKVRLFVDQKASCNQCRYAYPPLINRGQIQKRGVRKRLSCRCWKVQQMKWTLKMNRKSNSQMAYDLSVLFGFLALFVWFLELMLFDNYTGMLLIFCML